MRQLSAAGLLGASGLAASSPVALKMNRGVVDVTIDEGNFELPQSSLLDWVRVAGRAVTAYYGQFPVARARLRISEHAGHGVGGGHTDGDDGIWCRISVGAQTTWAELNEDWMLTHEMVHFAFPSVPRRHHWIEEGTATYVEPIARVQSGNLAAGQVWSDVMRDMHQGLPDEGDRGLDNTHTWGRTYWGGALFCLLADIEIRKNTANRKGLQDALRAVNRAGGTVDVEWPIEKALDIGDKAGDGKTLMALYGKMANDPAPVDLPDLWKQLGLRREGGRVVMDHSAPLASTRDAIMHGRAAA